MNIRMLSGALVVTAIACVLYGQPLMVTVDSGEMLVKKSSRTDWGAVDGMVDLAPGDSLHSASAGVVAVSLSGGISLKCKDSCVFTVSQAAEPLRIALVKGQLFFNDEGGSRIEVEAKGCLVSPLGTAAAVKITPKGDPSVAVVRGKVRITAPDGASVEAGAGSFCTFDVATAGFSPVKPLPQQALSSLEAWTGITAAGMDAAPAPEAAHGEPTPAQTANDADQGSGSVAPPPEQAAPSPVAPPAGKNAEPKEKPAPADKEKQEQAAQPTAPAPEVSAAPEEKGKGEDGAGKGKKGPEKPAWEMSAAMVTVDNEQWTRIALGVDVPIWRFGVCFDLELFLDAQGNFSNKGWNFDSPRDVGETLLRKIRYIRFNHPGDKLFVKVGGLDNVTFGYGFVVDRFTNMLHYPDEKLFGLQFELNDISPIGITVQALVPDFTEFADDGGVLAARLAFKPLKVMDKPIISKISIGATVASDLNQYAPARRWDYPTRGPEYDRDEDGIIDGAYKEQDHIISDGDSLSNAGRLALISEGRYDTLIAHKDAWARSKYDPATVLGGDVIVPIITSKILNLDVYGQVGVLVDDESEDALYKGWGIGAPGAALKVGPVWAQLEYRHIRDQFAPGYFDYYYLDERIIRNPEVSVKEDSLPVVNLNGVYGLLGLNLNDLVIVSGSYQRLTGDKGKRKELDQRAEAEAGLGQMLLERIPKINKVSLFYRQTNIDKREKRPFFYESIYTYWGFRLGVEVVQNTFVVWETRYGWKWNDSGTKLVDNKAVTITAGLTF